MHHNCFALRYPRARVHRCDAFTSGLYINLEILKCVASHSATNAVEEPGKKGCCNLLLTFSRPCSCRSLARPRAEIKCTCSIDSGTVKGRRVVFVEASTMTVLWCKAAAFISHFPDWPVDWPMDAADWHTLPEDVTIHRASGIKYCS